MIRAGDIVRVEFNNAQRTLCNSARVDHTPANSGDSWLFTDLETGEEHAVSEGCTVTKIKQEK